MNERKIRFSPVKLIPLSFLIVILIGMFLLMFPVATVQGRSAGALTALFTSTTSVCVTGLTVVDTCTYWSEFGQAVILVLVQIGGLGVVAVASMIMMMTRKKLSLGERLLLKDSLNIDKNKEILFFLKRIFKGVFITEGIGAMLFSIHFIPVLGVAKGIWASVFQSVSAFCNAGMDIAGSNSMIGYRDSSLVMTVTMILIILGGLGFVVWFDIADKLIVGIRQRYSPTQIISHLSEHSKLVLVATVFLILFGAVTFFVIEYDNPATIGNMSLPGKITNSLFQSITYRTAGFASVPQDGLTDASCVIGGVLMFIGGSPVGTAGGIKTVTAFLFFMNAFSYIRGRKEDVIFNKKVTAEMMKKASAIVLVSALTLFVVILLLLTRGLGLTDASYEAVSALGTVGLSRNITPTLDMWGRVIIIVSMYLGRIGPISMAFFFSKNNRYNKKIQHAEGNFTVG
ncbi:MAG: potassium transporter TrkG [Eubacterium sp.]|nr:potassium transporter TrkG [Eubacterium sp.]